MPDFFVFARRQFDSIRFDHLNFVEIFDFFASVPNMPILTAWFLVAFVVARFLSVRITRWWLAAVPAAKITTIGQKSDDENQNLKQ